MTLFRAAFGPAVMMLAACQSSGDSVPATLGSERDVELATAALTEYLGDASVQLGPDDPTLLPIIVVLPPPASPYEGRAIGTPRVFDIFLSQAGCSLQDRKTGDVIPLPGVSCEAV